MERWYCDVFAGGRRFGTGNGGGNGNSGDKGGAEAVSGGLVSGVAMLPRWRHVTGDSAWRGKFSK